MSDDIQKHVLAAFEHAKAYCGQGRVANYIPALAEVYPSKFCMAVALPNGGYYCAGDADEPFSIQSVSKVFTLPLALEGLEVTYGTVLDGSHQALHLILLCNWKQSVGNSAIH